MKIYSLNKKNLKPHKARPFSLEKDIQNIIENNLWEIFSLELVKSEFTVNNFRIDTLGFDKESNAFVIIEYKKGKNFSVIDQGYTYLSLLLNNKADFILEYNEGGNKTLKRVDIDWSQSKVLFVAPQYTPYQLHSINFKDVPFELWEINKYESNIIALVQHKPSSQVSITSVDSQKGGIVKEVAKEIKVYDEEYHLSHPKIKEKTKEFYFELKDRVMNLGSDISFVPRKTYISFKRETNFLDVHLLKEKLWCWINLRVGELDDPKGITRDVSKIGHYGNGDYELIINKDSDMEYVMFLINQSYRKQD